MCAKQSCTSHSRSRVSLSADRSVRMSYKRAVEEEAGARHVPSEAGRRVPLRHSRDGAVSWARLLRPDPVNLNSGEKPR